MEIRLKKQAQKYLDSVDEPTRKKLYKALDQLAQLKGEIVITVIEINTRTNIKY